MEVKRDRVRRAIGSSGLAVGFCGIGMSGGFGMTTLGGDTGGRYSCGRRIVCSIERGRARVSKVWPQSVSHMEVYCLMSSAGLPDGARLLQTVDCRMRCEGHILRRR